MTVSEMANSTMGQDGGSDGRGQPRVRATLPVATPPEQTL